MSAAITRRSLLAGTPAVVVAAAMPVSAAQMQEDPLIGLWRKWCTLSNAATKLANEARAIDQTLPKWASRFMGILVDSGMRGSVRCRVIDQVDDAMKMRGLPLRCVGNKEARAQFDTQWKADRDQKVLELEGARRRFSAARERSGITAKDAEYEAKMCEVGEIEDLIVDTQATTMDGLLVQALFFAELNKDEDQQYYDARIAKSMGIAARRLAPWLATTTNHDHIERLSGGAS